MYKLEETIPSVISIPGVNYECVFYHTDSGALQLYFKTGIGSNECDKLEQCLFSTVNTYNQNHSRPIAFVRRLGKTKISRKQLWFEIDFGGSDEDALYAVLGAFSDYDFVKKVVLK